MCFMQYKFSHSVSNRQNAIPGTINNILYVNLY